MEGLAAQLHNFLYLLSPYAPVLVLTASFFDILFLTGFLLYGGALVASILMLYGSGAIGAEALFISAYMGTFLGNCTNFLIGKYFGEYEFVKRKLQTKTMKKVQRFTHNHGLFICMAIGRFVTFIRPVYALVLGTTGLSPRRFFLYESMIAFIWIAFWVVVIVQGDMLLERLPR